MGRQNKMVPTEKFAPIGFIDIGTLFNIQTISHVWDKIK